MNMILIVLKRLVYRHLKSNNYVNNNKRPILKPPLIQDHLNRRENWAIFYQGFDWNNVIWSDKTSISIQANKLSKIWIHKDDNIVNRIVKYLIKIHIWARKHHGILKNHKLIIHVYDKTMNSEKIYIYLIFVYYLLLKKPK